MTKKTRIKNPGERIAVSRRELKSDDPYPDGPAYDHLLDRVVRTQTNAGPGEPAYEAIIHPPHAGRPRRGENWDSVQTAVRMPRALLDRATAKAKRMHLSLNAAIREAVSAWARQK
jgi:hypothetical protein